MTVHIIYGILFAVQSVQLWLVFRRLRKAQSELDRESRRSLEQVKRIGEMSDAYRQRNAELKTERVRARELERILESGGYQDNPLQICRHIADWSFVRGSTAYGSYPSALLAYEMGRSATDTDIDNLTRAGLVRSVREDRPDETFDACSPADVVRNLRAGSLWRSALTEVLRSGTIPAKCKTCLVCKGRGCSTCAHTGIAEVLW